MIIDNKISKVQMSHFGVDGKALPCVIKLKLSHFPLPQINLKGYVMEMLCPSWLSP